MAAPEKILHTADYVRAIEAGVGAHHRALISGFGTAAAYCCEMLGRSGDRRARGCPWPAWCAVSDAGTGLTGHVAACSAAYAPGGWPVFGCDRTGVEMPRPGWRRVAHAVSC